MKGMLQIKEKMNVTMKLIGTMPAATRLTSSITGFLMVPAHSKILPWHNNNCNKDDQEPAPTSLAATSGSEPFLKEYAQHF